MDVDRVTTVPCPPPPPPPPPCLTSQATRLTLFCSMPSPNKPVLCRPERRTRPMASPDRKDLFPGALEMMVLRALSQEPRHGYALVQHIKRTSNDLFQVEEGSLFPRSSACCEPAGSRPGGTCPPVAGVSGLYAITPVGRTRLEREVKRLRAHARRHPARPRPGEVMNVLAPAARPPPARTRSGRGDPAAPRREDRRPCGRRHAARARRSMWRIASSATNTLPQGTRPRGMALESGGGRLGRPSLRLAAMAAGTGIRRSPR